MLEVSNIPREDEVAPLPARQRPQRNSSEIVHSLFGDSVGVCWGDFSCNYHRQRGRLYVSSNAVSFFSNLFGFERRICLFYSQVSAMTLYRTTSVLITTNEGEEYIFKSFRDRIIVLELLMQLHSPSPTVTVGSSGREMKEEHYENYGSTELDNGEDCDSTADEPAHESSQRAMSVSSTSDAEVEVETLKVSGGDENGGPISPDESERLQLAWESCRNSTDTSYRDTAINKLILPCTLDEFFALFLSDEASHSIANFQSNHIGDSELDVTKWKLEESHNDRTCGSRTISFQHELTNIGMGPSSTMATRNQTFCRYGDLGLCLETRTYVKGVPVADAFYVEDKWIVERTGEEETSVELTVQHETRFVKRTMLKRLIQTTTKSQVQKWYKSYESMLHSALEKTSRVVRKDTLETPVDTLESYRLLWERERCLLHVIFATLFFLMSVVCFLCYQGLDLQRTIVSLQQDIDRLLLQNAQVLKQLEQNQ